MKYNHYIKVRKVDFDDSFALKIFVDSLQVFVTDLQSLRFWFWLEDDSESWFEDDNLQKIDTLMFSLSRSICIVSYMVGSHAIDSDKLSVLFAKYRAATGDDFKDTDLFRFVKLFMTKKQIDNYIHLGLF